MERYMNYKHTVQKNRKSTLERAQNFISSSLFKDNNLLGCLYKATVPLTSLEHYPSPAHITYAEAVNSDYKPTSVGHSFGYLWSTHWFLLEIDVPDEWEGGEVQLVWVTDAESLVWIQGHPVQGLTAQGNKNSYTLTRKHSVDKSHYKVHIEMAGCGVMGDGEGSMISPPDPHKTYRLQQAHAALFDRDVYDLIKDFEVINGIAKALPVESERGQRAMYTANAMVNVCIPSDKTTYSQARDVARRFLEEHGGEGEHVVYAVGHCHIDSAWLWPYSETIRKCGRSWASTVALMKQYPHFKFAASSAQQFTWVMEHYPSLFDDIKSLYKQGRFLPVGSTWVEMDGNMPNGESFIRQFYYGQRFFSRHFGPCQEFWLPDTFGYSGQLPQIMRMFGLKYFLTQKLSWNLINKFPHHSFWWEGIDGSTVLSHFPPGESYSMQGEPHELIKTVSNFEDKGRSRRSLYLFGDGDGGQGPSGDMLERLSRMEDVDGLPRVKMSSPGEFFSLVEHEDGEELCRWVGELFLELHNGTYTTQATTKSENRELEQRLQAVEAVSTMAWLETRDPGVYPRDDIEAVWKAHLLNQFHDVLPGSSVHAVYEDVKKINQDLRERTDLILQSAASPPLHETPVTCDDLLLFNTASWPFSGVVAVSAAHQQQLALSSPLAFVHVPSYGYAKIEPTRPSSPVTLYEDGEGFCFTNEYIRSRVNHLGHVTELVVLADPLQRNVFAGAGHHGNQFVLYDDQPLFWDAWDIMHYHNEKRQDVTDVVSPPVVVDDEPLRAAVRLSLRVGGKSHITQTVSLDAATPYLSFTNQIEWRESRKLLRSEFMTNIRAMEATYETQFGHVTRPTHDNTSWDVAKFEVCCHKWMDLSEHGFGVSLLNNTRYGCSTARNVLKLSLLRSPKAPDAEADMGQHTVHYALMPHIGSFQDAGVIQRAVEFNWSCVTRPYLRSNRYHDDSKSYVTVDTPQVVLDSLSMHLDDSKSVCLRFYESYGGTTMANVTLGFKVVAAHICDGYGSSLQELTVSESRFRMSFQPFQVISVVLTCDENL